MKNKIALFLTGVIIFIGIIIAIVIIIITQNNNSTSTDPSKQETQQISNASEYKKYQNTNIGYEVMIPNDLSSITDQKNTLYLQHYVPYEHNDPCNFKGSGSGVLSKLVDFKVSLIIHNTTLTKTIQKNESKYFIEEFMINNKLKVEPGFIDIVEQGNKKGYKITSGVEGCGIITYYINLTPKKTLVIYRTIITELTGLVGNMENFLSIPGIVTPEKEEEFINKIIETFILL